MARMKKNFRHFGRVRHPARRILRRVGWFTALFFVVYTLVANTLLTTYSAGSGSMEPTLSAGDRVFATPVVFGVPVPFTQYRLGGTRTPQRGELVVCSPPFAEDTTFQKVADPFTSFFTLQNIRMRDGSRTTWESSLLIKRVIGIPGDTITMDEFVALIRPAGESEFMNERELSRIEYSISFRPLPEDWAPLLPLSGSSIEPLVLGENEYFVLGDNRTQSHDSRHFGVLDLTDFRQKVLFRYWPFRRIGVP
jgi:signal peptidase I